MKMKKRKRMVFGVCPVCGQRRKLSRHHILKWKVFKNDDDNNIIYICEKCHNQGKNCLEELIRERENAVLEQFPELYYKALRDYLAGVRPNRRREKYAESIPCRKGTEVCGSQLA
jgi:cytochrome c553